MHGSLAKKTSEEEPSQILTDVIDRLSMTSTLKEVTTIVAEAARKLCGADGATFVLKEGQQCFYVDENAISPLWKGNKFPLETCISGWSMIHRETVLIRDIYEDARIPWDAYRPTFVKSLCMVPIRSGNPLGAIGNYWAKTHTPTKDEVKFLQILANTAAVALENLELKRILMEKKSAHVSREKELEMAIHSMAHDLRNPLAFIKGFAQLLQIHAASQLNERTSNYVSSILKTCNQAAKQIDQMLALHRISTKSLMAELINLSELSLDWMKNTKINLGSGKIDLQVEKNLFVFADPFLIGIVLDNLFSNALKFTSQRSVREIKLGKKSQDGDYVTFFLRDNGIGFDASVVPKLFHSFVRLHKESIYPGHGIGLVSVAKIVEAHGGKITVESKPDEGATFYFSLPVKNVGFVYNNIK